MDIDIGELEMASVEAYVVFSEVVTRREGHDQFHVDMDFCCDLEVFDCYDNVPLGHTARLGFMTKSVRLDIKQLLRDPEEESCGMIARELGEWPLLDDRNRGKLSEFSFKMAKDITRRFMPPQHNVLVIPFRVMLDCNRHVAQNVPEWMDDPVLSDHEDDFEMVPPASDSADFEMVPADHEYLKMKTTTTTTEDEDQSCCICLDDFYAGCQVLSIPCSHIFHEDCINKWLQSSNCCPMCRFQILPNVIVD